MKIDAKRIIGRDGWAMLVAVGDEVEGEVCEWGMLAHLHDGIRPPTGTGQDVRGGPREFNLSLGMVRDRELRADETELWVEFDASVAAHRGRRAALARGGQDAVGSISICTPEVRTLPGDREQRLSRLPQGDTAWQ